MRGRLVGIKLINDNNVRGCRETLPLCVKRIECRFVLGAAVTAGYLSHPPPQFKAGSPHAWSRASGGGGWCGLAEGLFRG